MSFFFIEPSGPTRLINRRQEVATLDLGLVRSISASKKQPIQNPPTPVCLSLSRDPAPPTSAKR